MSGQHHTDRAKTKRGDLREEVAQRVGLSAKEQALCRVEGWKMSMRAIRELLLSEYATTLDCASFASELDDLMGTDGVRRWGELFDATD